MVDRRWAITRVDRSARVLSIAFWNVASLTLSRADVASSRIRTSGVAMMTLAMATRCRWPPLSLLPRDPTSVPYPAGNFMMKLCALAALHAASISAWVAFSFPMATLSRIVPGRRGGCCATSPTLPRSHCRL